MPRATKAQISYLNEALPPQKKRGRGRPPKLAFKHRIFSNIDQIIDVMKQNGERVQELEVEEDRIVIKTTSDNS
jgi:hypothetical protein